MNQIHEIAVRQVKSGREASFRKRRQEFIEALKRQSGVGADREFESFMALPEPDGGEVFIGMTTYDSLAANAAIQRRPSVVWRFLRFASTMKLKAYVYVRPVEGPPFDLAAIAAEPGKVLELAVRRVDPGDRDEFDRARREFVELLAQQDGVSSSWEFEVVKGKKAGGLAVGMTVYESREALEAMMERIMAHPITQGYFARFEPVAIQYATSTTT